MDTDSQIIFEMKIAGILLLLLVFWVWSIYFTEFDILRFPATLFTGLMLVFGGVWIGIAINKRRREYGKSGLSEKNKK